MRIKSFLITKNHQRQLQSFDRFKKVFEDAECDLTEQTNELRKIYKSRQFKRYNTSSIQDFTTGHKISTDSILLSSRNERTLKTQT